MAKSVKSKKNENNENNVENDPYAGLNAHWRKFFNKFEEINDPNLKVSKWKEVHVLAHICKRYKDLYKRKFSVTIKGAPSKSPDIYVIKRMIAYLNTTNMNVVKQYVDWVFDTKIIPKKTVFRKVGYFLTEGFANEFNHERLKEKEITRTTELPPGYVSIANDLGIKVKNYGDLAFIKMANDRNLDKTSSKYVLLMNLEMLGLNLDKLKEL